MSGGSSSSDVVGVAGMPTDALVESLNTEEGECERRPFVGGDAGVESASECNGEGEGRLDKSKDISNMLRRSGE